MKSFGYYLNQIIDEYKKYHPQEDLDNDVEVYFINNWKNITEQIEEEPLKKSLRKSEFISLQDNILNIRILDSNERFFVSMKEKDIIRILENQLSDFSNFGIKKIIIKQ